MIITPQNTKSADSKSAGLGSFIKASISRIKWLFVSTVVFPTTIAIIYYGFIASDVFISESQFVVRSPEKPSSSPLGALFKGVGFSRSQDDSYVVKEFILSRDALVKLDENMGFRQAYSNQNVDFISRFAGLDWDNSFEAMHRYYQKKIATQLDSSSSITTLTVRAFTEEDAYRINKALLLMSEVLVNQLNENGRRDMIKFAVAEVGDAESKAKAAALALSNFRNQKGVIDPEKQSAIQLQQISRLQEQLLTTKSQLAQLITFTKDNPQIPTLQKQVEILQNEIAIVTSSVTGGEKSLSTKAAEYQRLQLEREFADRQLAGAMASQVQARNEAVRKQLYLERISLPSKPDMAMEPRRFYGVLSTLLLGLAAWGVLAMLLAGIREHKD
ncbi:MAG: capsule biosynthesis protein [Methylotenera sp.]|uniref:capsule biosynthesis protein n=1 Tax=Methylotenera sp. TaxID=2051956 RepID=UPI00248914B4|nr:capsule biosynthesis protein [Methylotenera sp.]MDI1307904.1 capsule biosynthesis protein [Methylotenera sp.]